MTLERLMETHYGYGSTLIVTGAGGGRIDGEKPGFG